ncbi:hypothetical protein B0H12DRAFT_1080376 [Mycena haematopus]|nr:hypothetical protein B0H12DRAFT_1080376 [Mycena haematopus]
MQTTRSGGKCAPPAGIGMIINDVEDDFVLVSTSITDGLKSKLRVKSVAQSEFQSMAQCVSLLSQSDIQHDRIKLAHYVVADLHRQLDGLKQQNKTLQEGRRTLEKRIEELEREEFGRMGSSG